jgi:hypothetical protein
VVRRFRPDGHANLVVSRNPEPAGQVAPTLGRARMGKPDRSGNDLCAESRPPGIPILVQRRRAWRIVIGPQRLIHLRRGTSPRMRMASYVLSQKPHGVSGCETRPSLNLQLRWQVRAFCRMIFRSTPFPRERLTPQR